MAAEVSVDLAGLALHPGQAARLDFDLGLAPPVLGGVAFPLSEGKAAVRVEVSRTTTGYAFRLRGEPRIEGPCARCLRAARRTVPIDAREIDQAASDDPELNSPYVDQGFLDVSSWARDALTLAMPEKVLCRDECPGLCEICGAVLDEVDPEVHRHEAPLDPRFAKLRELGGS